jgi:hypothetical protein
MVPQWVRDRDAKQHTAKQARKIANEKKARETKANKVDALIAAHPVLAWLSYIHGGNLDRWLEGRYGATVSMDNFLSDMHWALDKGEMSERQIAAAENSVNRIFNRYAATQKREAEKAATVASGVKAPEGKVTVTGKVVSIKDQVNDFSYYGGVIWKMVVKTDDGWAVWTTIPAKLIDSLSDISGADWRDRILNRTVTFTATLTRSDRDPLFAFGKRPSQASIVE